MCAVWLGGDKYGPVARPTGALEKSKKKTSTPPWRDINDIVVGPRPQVRYNIGIPTTTVLSDPFSYLARRRDDDPSFAQTGHPGRSLSFRRSNELII